MGPLQTCIITLVSSNCHERFLGPVYVIKPLLSICPTKPLAQPCCLHAWSLVWCPFVRFSAIHISGSVLLMFRAQCCRCLGLSVVIVLGSMLFMCPVVGLGRGRRAAAAGAAAWSRPAAERRRLWPGLGRWLGAGLNPGLGPRVPAARRPQWCSALYGPLSRSHCFAQFRITPSRSA